MFHIFFHWNSFRIVCIVAIIEKLQQHIDYKMGFSVDPNRDDYSTFTYEGTLASVIGKIHFEIQGKLFDFYRCYVLHRCYCFYGL